MAVVSEEREVLGQQNLQWGEDSWRTRAVWVVNLATIVLTTIPIAAAVWQGSSRAGYFLIFVAVLLASMLVRHRYPRVRAILLVAFWYTVSLITLYDGGFSVPTSTLSLAVASSLLGVLWGRTGFLLGILAMGTLFGSAYAYFFSFGGALPVVDQAYYSGGEANFLRSALFAFSQIIVLTLTMSYIAERQGEALTMLRRENRDREKAEMAFLEAQRAELVARITGGLAHNFGNALTVITTWTELLQRNPDNRVYIERAMRDMSEAARQATQVSKQVMTLSKNYVRRLEVVAVDEVIEPQVGLFKTLLPAYIEFTAELEPDLYILADRSDMQQALLNLVLNARDAVGDDGKIALTAVRDGDKVCIEVRDNGVGIDPMIIDKVFEPFFSTKGAEGTGLGLASVRQSVENADGEVDVVSQTGVGTTFTMLFDARPAPDLEKEATQAHEVLSDIRANIIVADDEEIVLRALVAALENAGHTIHKAANVDEAITLMGVTPDVDMLVTDAIMPGGNVSDLIGAFTQRFPGAPVLVCSGYVEEDVLARNLKAGEFAFLQKPVSSSNLRNKVRELLSERERSVE